MCGIYGIISSSPNDYSMELLQSFFGHLKHRGPDDFGLLFFSPDSLQKSKHVIASAKTQVVLGHRRLSILDLSDNGWQPMSSQDNRLHIVFNGEVYNFIEIRTELQKLGYEFISGSDTEVILHAWREWGPSCLVKFIGMFAFSILDTFQKKIFFARDPFGIKPLYYAKWSGGIAFSSEIPPLLELEGVTSNANASRTYQYLRFSQTDHDDRTMFEDVFQLPAAHYLEISLVQGLPMVLQKYWTLELSDPLDISFVEATSHLRELFLESIKLHLRSDVPIGTALSGGVDSSAIVGAMRHLDPKLQIHAFSYIADEKKISEEHWVDTVVESNNVNVHKIYAGSENFLDDLNKIVRSQGEPFGSTSIYAQYKVFESARTAGIKVMLDGQGADEMLGGYASYSAARFSSLIKQGDVVGALSFLSNVSRLPGREATILRSGMYLLPDAIQEIGRVFTGQTLLPSWMNHDWLINENVLVKPQRNSYGKQVLREDLLATLTRLHLPSLLRYEDRNSMVHSIESRVPFLTAPIAHFLLNLPENFLISDTGTTKSIFKESMRGIVADSILDRKDKVGFATPEKKWLNSQSLWIENCLNSYDDEIPVLKKDILLNQWKKMRAGEMQFDTRIWKCVNLILWSKQYNVSF
jgi:asparagine synthase (glutamine-hydrolysing)